MPVFIDPTGQSTYGIALCARCSRKFPLAELFPDPNSQGLMVCRADLDDYDPYRLPFNPLDADITLPFVRPDVPLTGHELDAYMALATETNINIFILTESGHPLELEGLDV